MKHLLLVLSILAVCQPAAAVFAQDASDSRPPVHKVDVDIVRRAREILDSEAHWNRHDTRVCPSTATVFSVYCALEKATAEINGAFLHRDAAMQEARFVIDALKPHANYEHRLMNYNNDPATTFADIRHMLDLLEQSIKDRLKAEGDTAPSAPHAAAASDVDVRIARRAREILSSSSAWSRARTQDCPADATTFNLYCALEKAQRDVTGSTEVTSGAMKEARRVIGETAPNQSKYTARLVDYNADPTISFADVQKLLQTVEERLTHPPR